MSSCSLPWDALSVSDAAKAEPAKCAVQDVMSLNSDLPVGQVIDAYVELAEKTLLIDPSLPNSNILTKSSKGLKFTKIGCWKAKSIDTPAEKIGTLSSRR